MESRLRMAAERGIEVRPTALTALSAPTHRSSSPSSSHPVPHALSPSLPSLPFLLPLPSSAFRSRSPRPRTPSRPLALGDPLSEGPSAHPQARKLEIEALETRLKFAAPPSTQVRPPTRRRAVHQTHSRSSRTVSAAGRLGAGGRG